MNATLCLDFGNSLLKAAVFLNDEIHEVIVLSENIKDDIKALLHKYKPGYSVLSSVINHDPEIENLIKDHSSFHKISNKSNLPFTIHAGKSETIGTDRLALCAASAHLFPHKNNLAIGLGTCITYNFLNKNHQFLGGAISPGLDMRFRSMHAETALLPLVQMDWNFPLIGYDTKTNLLSGVA